MVVLFVERIRFVEKRRKERSSLFAAALSSPAHLLFSRSRCWSTFISRATRLRAAQEFGVARSYPTLVGLGGGHCLAAFCLALLMVILYRKVCLLSIAILFVERIRFQLPARSQLLNFQLPAASSQALLRPRKGTQASRAHTVRRSPLGRSGPFGYLYYTIKRFSCQSPAYLLNK